MKVYQDLVFSGDRTALDRFIADVEQRLDDGWSRFYERESEARRSALRAMYCFSCTKTASRPASELWITTRSDGALYVSNILATNYASLTYDQYNAILREFHERFALQAANKAGVKAELGNPDPQIEDFLSGTTARLLRTFSCAANKAVLHPLDRKPWNHFLTAAYREGASLDSSLLQRWLIEEEKWPEDKAIDLIIEYEHARDLLETYESQQA
jgi:hypothetical protein